jgi:D-alanyl-D-alanine carboxypeptidase
MPTRTALRAGAIAVVAVVLPTTAFVTPVTAAGMREVASAGEKESRHHTTQRAMDAAVEAGVPGVTGQAHTTHGTWNGTSGVADLTTQRPRLPQDRYRVGSITKTFVATTLLQLEAENRLGLDDPVERWLPGLVHGNGYDGTRITVRELLNHTSGVYNYSDDPGFRKKAFGPGFLERRYDTYRPEELVDIAMGHKPEFEPGTGWSYSNTNYILAAMIIEEVTGNPYGEEIRDRILRPLGLRATTVPGTDHRMPPPSGRAYSKPPEDPKGTTYDVTELNPSMAWAAGEMISTSADLNRFYSALLRGKLLPPAQQRALTDTVRIDPDNAGRGYGLGLQKQKLSCGKEVWGHDGGIPGSSSDAVTTKDGRHSLAFNFNGDWSGGSQTVVEAEFCAK